MKKSMSVLSLVIVLLVGFAPGTSAAALRSRGGCRNCGQNRGGFPSFPQQQNFSMPQSLSNLGAFQEDPSSGEISDGLGHFLDSQGNIIVRDSGRSIVVGRALAINGQGRIVRFSVTPQPLQSLQTLTSPSTKWELDRDKTTNRWVQKEVGGTESHDLFVADRPMTVNIPNGAGGFFQVTAQLGDVLVQDPNRANVYFRADPRAAQQLADRYREGKSTNDDMWSGFSPTKKALARAIMDRHPEGITRLPNGLVKLDSSGHSSSGNGTTGRTTTPAKTVSSGKKAYKKTRSSFSDIGDLTDAELEALLNKKDSKVIDMVCVDIAGKKSKYKFGITKGIEGEETLYRGLLYSEGKNNWKTDAKILNKGLYSQDLDDHEGVAVTVKSDEGSPVLNIELANSVGKSAPHLYCRADNGEDEKVAAAEKEEKKSAPQIWKEEFKPSKAGMDPQDKAYKKEFYAHTQKRMINLLNTKLADYIGNKKGFKALDHEVDFELQPNETPTRYVDRLLHAANTLDEKLAEMPEDEEVSKGDLEKMRKLVSDWKESLLNLKNNARGEALSKETEELEK